MAEAEEVLQDAARHAAVFARDLWRRHRKGAPGEETTTLRDQAPRLDLLLTAVFARSFPLKTAEAPAPPTFLTRVFRGNEGPAVRLAVPATDGVSIWLPESIAAKGALPGPELLRISALRQATLAQRGSAALWLSFTDRVQQAFFHLLECQAADRHLAQTLPGLVPLLESLRREALAARPPLEAFPTHRQQLEKMVRALLASPVAGPVASLQEVASEARRRGSGADAGVPTKGRLLYRDGWTGEFRAPSGAISIFRSAHSDKDAPTDAAMKSARLGRSPKVREAAEDEDDKTSGTWMVQPSQPHEQAEDPNGLQRPTDRDETTAAEELADSLSELPEARLVSTPGSPKEILLSQDTPDARRKLPPLSAACGEEQRLLYPEWDHRAGAYIEGGVTVHLKTMPEGSPAWVERTLDEYRGMLQLVKRRFEMLKAQRLRLRRQLDGDEIDLDAYVEAMADFRAGLPLSQGLYQSSRESRRDMAVLILTDASGSTDSWVSNGKRVVDVEREALLLVAIALDGMREPFALQAFSGEGPRGVVVTELKRFDEAFGDPVSRRIAALEPEHYTRAGAALRHATASLMGQLARHRLLLLLSDGKPNDVDEYEGQYGVEDMRQAVTEARLQGISCFCLTVDRQAAGYLPAVFGAHRYGLLPRPELLPTVLLDWMRRLVQA